MDKALEELACGGMADAVGALGQAVEWRPAQGAKRQLHAVLSPVAAPVTAEYGGAVVAVTAVMLVPYEALAQPPRVFDKAAAGGQVYQAVRVQDVPLSRSWRVELTSSL